jgi:RNA 2',3'-cyclic 3'-phosphodiesterase
MVEGAEKHRLFVAIHVPEAVKESLREMQKELASVTANTVRWSSPEQLHLTLLFLGHVESAALPNLKPAFETVCQEGSAMRFNVKGLGCFPNPRRPRVVWAGLEGDVEKLKAFQRKIHDSLTHWCQKEEDREYRPHLTLGRVREGARVPKLGEALQARTAATFGGFVAEGCSLMRSQLSTHGAVYSEVSGASFPR